MRTIRFPDLPTMLEACALLIPHGVTFEADATTLTITFSGGY